jgi:signal transduction histidine kinase
MEVLLSAACFAVACGAVSECRRRRRARARLDGAIHELRRPLQALALAIEAESPGGSCEACLEQARRALDELEDAVAGRRPGRAAEPISAAEIVTEAGRRWGLIAGVRVRTPRSDLQLIGDRARLAQGIDNLIANALEHGRGPVCVEAVADGDTARFEVRDSGWGDLVERRRRREDPRRGLGLRVAAQIAREHGGDLEPPESNEAGTAAALRLPADLAGSGDVG